MRLIDADAFIAKLDHVPMIQEAIKKAMDTMSTIEQLEIIRCKDCIHSDIYPKDADNDMPLKCLNIRYGGVMPDWYCEHAERRTDEQIR